jgi:hypothetical protein
MYSVYIYIYIISSVGDLGDETDVLRMYIYIYIYNHAWATWGTRLMYSTKLTLTLRMLCRAVDGILDPWPMS